MHTSPLYSTLAYIFSEFTTQNDSNSINWIPLIHLEKLFKFTTSFFNFQFDRVNCDQMSEDNPLARPLAYMFMVKIDRCALGNALQTKRAFNSNIYLVEIS